MDVQKLGVFIQTRRKELGMTQGEIAARLNVTDKAISRWERCVGFPDIQLLEPLAEALQISVQELMRCERMNPEQMDAGMTEAITETIAEIKKETWLGKYRRVLTLLCFLVYELFYVLSGNPRYADQQVWMSPMNSVLFIVTVAAFIYTSYREEYYEAS